MTTRLILTFVVCTRCMLRSHAETPVAAPRETVFFAFDDHNLAWQHNLKLTLVSPDKHPANPVVHCGLKGSPDYGHANLYGTVIHDGRTAASFGCGISG